MLPLVVQGITYLPRAETTANYYCLLRSIVGASLSRRLGLDTVVVVGWLGGGGVGVVVVGMVRVVGPGVGWEGGCMGGLQTMKDSVVPAGREDDVLACHWARRFTFGREGPNDCAEPRFENKEHLRLKKTKRSQRAAPLQRPSRD